MEIRKIEVGLLNENCYILCNNEKALIIDPGDDASKIKKEIKEKVVGILITHYHFDHIGALKELKEIYNAPVYDYSNLKEGINIIDEFNFNAIYVPGHKEDLVAYLFDNNLFCGDFIFANAIGRWDLKGGSFPQMQNSIKKILKYNDNIIIYPGHGPSTTLKEEKENLIKYIKE